MGLKMNNVIIIDRNQQPLGFLSKNRVKKLEKDNLGIYRTDFLFQMKSNYKCKFDFYDMYVTKIENFYNVVIKNNIYNVFSIDFHKLKNVYSLTKFINIENIYFDEINQDILKTFEKIKYLVKDVSEANTLYINEFSKKNIYNINEEVINLNKKNKILKNEKQLYNIYRYKFYLDANHFVKFANSIGEKHPHTWEFLVELKNRNSELVMFTDIENVFNEILEPYQDKLINKTEPFTKLNPTTENMGNYFKNLTKEKFNSLNWDLLRFEISESPNRTYILTEDYSL